MPASEDHAAGLIVGQAAESTAISAARERVHRNLGPGERCMEQIADLDGGKEAGTAGIGPVGYIGESG